MKTGCKLMSKREHLPSSQGVIQGQGANADCPVLCSHPRGCLLIFSGWMHTFKLWGWKMQNIVAPLHAAKGNSLALSVIFPQRGVVPPLIIFEPCAPLVMENKHEPVRTSVTANLADARCQFVLLQFLLARGLLARSCCPCGDAGFARCEQSRSACLSCQYFLAYFQETDIRGHQQFPRGLPKSWYPWRVLRAVPAQSWV